MLVLEKIRQHKPLNRQAERHAREGVSLAPSTVADRGPRRLHRAEAAASADRVTRIRRRALARRRHPRCRCSPTARPPFGGGAPPAHERGEELGGSGWFGLVGPGDLPRSIVEIYSTLKDGYSEKRDINCSHRADLTLRTRITSSSRRDCIVGRLLAEGRLRLGLVEGARC